MIKQNPFSLYDFLGYFIPGALLSYLVLLIDRINKYEGEIEFIDFLEKNKDFQIEKFLFFLIISYSIGHLLNFISSITIEKYANWIYNYPSKYLLGFKKPKSLKTLNIRRLIIVILIFPVSFLDLVLGNIFSFKNFYTRELDPFLIEVIKEKGIILINQLFKNKINNEEIKKIRDYDFFRIYAHYTFENSKNHQFKLVNYVVLYGFLRTLTLISIIVFWFLVYMIFIEKWNVFNYNILILNALVSYTFFMAFMKFYRRYTLEGLMLIAIDKEIK